MNVLHILATTQLMGEMRSTEPMDKLCRMIIEEHKSCGTQTTEDNK